MIRLPTRVAIIVGIPTLAVLLVAATASVRPVLLSISPDPGMVRPRNYCIMNPFRDRSPERAAERLLNELRQGNIGVLATVDLEVADPSSRSHIVEQESKWPVQGWRIGRRKQKPDRTELMYWVTRGNGYSEDGYEEEVYVTVRGSGPSARVIDFAAIY